jgi:hypothetical protein
MPSATDFRDELIAASSLLSPYFLGGISVECDDSSVWVYGTGETVSAQDAAYNGAHDAMIVDANDDDDEVDVVAVGVMASNDAAGEKVYVFRMPTTVQARVLTAIVTRVLEQGQLGDLQLQQCVSSECGSAGIIAVACDRVSNAELFARKLRASNPAVFGSVTVDTDLVELVALQNKTKTN